MACALVLLISVILLNILELKVKKNEMNAFIEAWDILYLLDILYLRYRYIYGAARKNGYSYADTNLCCRTIRLVRGTRDIKL